MTSHGKDAPGGTAQIIVVTGATGNQGGAAAAPLLTAGWRVRALTTDPASRAARALARAGAEVTAGDLDDPGSPRAAADSAYGVSSVQQEHRTARRRASRTRTGGPQRRRRGRRRRG